MPKATLTSRVLKNKDTGLEIQVPTFKVTKELLTSTVHYQVVLASNLACFKLPSHKESDVVQYSIERKLSEFEDLKSKLQAQFPGTMLPPINKKSIITNDAVLRERRASLDHFMKSIASVRTLSTCVSVLEFLGVDKLRARKFNRGEPLDNKTSAPVGDTSGIGEAEGESESSEPIVFGDEDDSGNEDLFGDDDGKDRTDDLFGNEEDEGDGRPGNVKIFQRQDLKRDLTEEDEKDFTTFIPGAILTKTQTVRTRREEDEVVEEEEEDHSDLFEIEDDLDKLMTVKTNTGTTKNASPAAASPSPAPPQKAQPPKSSSKPSVLPPPPTKPSIPSKPKPQIATKPTKHNLSSPSSSSSSTSNPPSSSSSSSSSLSTNKPDLPKKPTASSFSSMTPDNDSTSKDKRATVSSSPSATKESRPLDTGEVGAVDSLGQDDILKYLQDNLDSNAEEVDLFS